MSRSFAQVSLFAMTLGLAALGSTLTPAAALPSIHPGSAMIHAPQTAPGASAHPGSTTIQNLHRPPAPPPPPPKPTPQKRPRP
jgi:hypothetical protein